MPVRATEKKGTWCAETYTRDGDELSGGTCPPGTGTERPALGLLSCLALRLCWHWQSGTDTRWSQCSVICHDRLYSNIRLFLGPAGGIGFSQLWATYRLTMSPTIATRNALCFSEKQPFKDHAAVPAMVKRESVELGAQRNWLLTRLSPTSTAETYTQSQWLNAPTAARAFAAPPMPDARLQAPAWTLRRPAVKKGCASTAKHPGPYYHDCSTRVCARSDRVRQLGDTEEEQWAISPLTLCGVSV